MLCFCSAKDLSSKTCLWYHLVYILNIHSFKIPSTISTMFKRNLIWNSNVLISLVFILPGKYKNWKQTVKLKQPYIFLCILNVYMCIKIWICELIEINYSNMYKMHEIVSTPTFTRSVRVYETWFHHWRQTYNSIAYCRLFEKYIFNHFSCMFQT